VWLWLFPRRQLLILNSEALFEDPQQSVDTAMSFLGLTL